MVIGDISYAFLYDRKDTYMYKLDPRIKLVYVGFTTLTVFFAKNPAVGVAVLLIQVLIAFSGGLLKKVVSLIKGLTPLLLFIMAFNTALVYLTSPSIDIQLLIYTFFMMIVRVFTTLIAFTVLTSTTSPQELMQAFVKMKISYVYAYPLIIVYRFIPIIFQEMNNIYDAQRARGLELERGSFIRRFRNIVPIIIPSIVSALFKARDLAEAMEARSFGALPQRTFFKEIRIKKLDLLFILTVILIELACFPIAWLFFS
ncbi:MAG: hypothetical protein DRJ44_02345 [Thermoprotei archaeon]|nr:MAG: hypothetical protein DRJ44_02345 [Thermoprotei archaeon]